MALFNYYPWSDYHNLNLDWIIKVVKDYVEKTDNYIIKVDDFIEYVNNYFENLDVQDEIDNKLQEMYDNGELASLIAQYLQTTSLIVFNTINDMKAADNLVSDITVLCLGDQLYNDGITKLFYIRALTVSDIVDEINIVSLNNYPSLIAELIPNSNINRRIKNHIRYFIDTVNGDDKNSGLTQAEAFKTLNKFLELSNTNTELRGYLVTAGDYTWSYGDTNASCSIHLTALSGGIRVLFDNTEADVSTAFYNSHLNIQGVDNSNKIELLMLDTSGDLYFDCCLISLTDVIINPRIRLYGSSLIATRIVYSSIICNYSKLAIGGAHCINTDPNITPLTLTNSIGQLTGTWTGEELISNGTVPYLSAPHSYLYIGAVIVPALNTFKYGYGLRFTGGSIITLTNSRETNCGARSLNGNQINANNTEACIIQSDQGLKAFATVRYYNGALQYWNGTTWTNITL